MIIYWNLASIPELKALSPEERKQVWRTIYSKPWQHWPVIISFILGILLIGIGAFGGMFLGYLFWPNTLWGPLVATLLGGCIFIIIDVFIENQMFITYARPYIHKLIIENKALGSQEQSYPE